MSIFGKPFTVMTVGTFDVFHEGHRALLEWCRRLAGRDGQLIVGVNTDSFVQSYKGKAPVQELPDRVHGVCAYGHLLNNVVHNVQQTEGDSMHPLLDEQRPDLLVVGDDWMGPHYLEQIGVTMDQLFELGITLAFKPRGPNPIHSSKVRGDG